MAKHLFKGEVDFLRNKLFNVICEHHTSDPTGTTPSDTGRLIYNTTTKAYKYFDGDNWKSVGNITVSSTTATSAITVTKNGDNYDLTLGVDNSTIEISNGVVRLMANSVGSDHIKTGAVTFEKMQHLPAMTVIGNIGATDSEATAVKIETEINDTTASNSNHLVTIGAVKSYVDAIATGSLKFIGEWVISGSGAETTFPVNVTSANTKKGDYWIIKGSNTISGVTLDEGDMVIVKQDNPTNTNKDHYIFIEGNRGMATDQISGLVKLTTQAEINTTNGNSDNVVTVKTLNTRLATTAIAGLIKIATEAQVNAGTDNESAVTALTLKNYVIAQTKNSFESAFNTATVDIPHNLNTNRVLVSVYETDGTQVWCPIKIKNENEITITQSPVSDLRVVILKGNNIAN